MRRIFRGKLWIANIYNVWTYCRLMGHRMRAYNARLAFERAPKGVILALQRENHPKDPNAVRVMYGKHWVGYLPREISSTVATQMDNGMAHMVQVVYTKYQAPCLRIRLHPAQVQPGHPWHEQLTGEDSELEERKQKAGYYNQLNLFEN